MVIISCTTESLDLRIPECGGTEMTAFITKPNGLVKNLTVSTEDEVIKLTGWPEGAKGSFTLCVQTQCGCYSQQVYLDCPAPENVPVNKGSGLPEAPYISCHAV